MHGNICHTKYLLFQISVLIAGSVFLAHAQDTSSFTPAKSTQANQKGSAIIGAQRTTQDKTTWSAAKPTTGAKSSATIGQQSKQTTPAKTTAWTAATPTKTNEKSTVTIGQQREQAQQAQSTTSAETTKKKSALKSVLKGAGKAAPVIIEHAPALLQSAKTLASGGAGTPETMQQTQNLQGGKASDIKQDLDEEEQLEEDEPFDSYEYLYK